MINKNRWRCESDQSTIHGIIEELARKTIMWQKEYNKAATKIEELTGNKQMKVIVKNDNDIINEIFDGDEYGMLSSKDKFE